MRVLRFLKKKIDYHETVTGMYHKGLGTGGVDRTRPQIRMTKTSSQTLLSHLPPIQQQNECRFSKYDKIQLSYYTI